MDKQLQSLVAEIESASGKIDADMHIANLRILDVYTETVYPGSMVIKNGKIVAINPSWIVQAEQVFDGRGMFAVPGFMKEQNLQRPCHRTGLGPVERVCHGRPFGRSRVR